MGDITIYNPWGPVDVEYKSNDLGFKLEDVEISVENVLIDKKVAEYGDMIVDQVNNGLLAEVTMVLAENDHTRRLVVYPLGNENGGNKVRMGQRPGQSLLALAGLLVLHPSGVDAGDLSEDWGFYKAVVVAKEPLVKGHGEGKNTNTVTFRCYPDLSRSGNDLICYVGGASS